MDHSEFFESDLSDANLSNARLQHAKFDRAILEGANFTRSVLSSTEFTLSAVDGKTIFDEIEFNEEPDFSGVGLDSMRIDPSTKELLKTYIRKKQCEIGDAPYLFTFS